MTLSITSLRPLFLLVAAVLPAGCAVGPQVCESKLRCHPKPKSSALIPRGALFGSTQTSGVQISPDGTKIAYLTTAAGITSLFVRSLDSGVVRRVVRGEIGCGLSPGLWAPDGKSLLFWKDRDGDERYALWQVQLDPVRARQVLPAPQSRRFRFLGAKEDALLVSVWPRVCGCFNPKVYRVNLKTGTAKEVTPKWTGCDVVRWYADRQLRVRAAEIRNRQGGTVLMARLTPSARWRPIRALSAEERLEVHGFSPDGASLFFADDLGSPTLRLYRADLEPGRLFEVFRDANADLSDVVFEEGRIVAVSTERERLSWKVLDQQVVRDWAALQQQLGHDFKIVSRSRGGLRWIIAAISDLKPVRYYLYDREKTQLSILASSMPKLHRYGFSPVKPVTVTTRDGLELLCYLTLPTRSGSTKLPLVLLVHGGPAARDHWVFDPEVQWLANRGYAVLQVNYRGSTGVGRKCHAAGKDNRYGNRVHEDLADAVKWAVKNASVDPRRVAVIGGSFGGYAALAGAAFSPDVYAAAASYFGVSGLIEMRRECLPRHLSLLDIRRLSTRSRWKRMYKYSPLLAADKIKAPLLIAHGANDPRVNPSQSRMMVDAVRDEGGCVEYVVYQGEGHGLVRLANRLDFHRRMEVFLGRHLCGRVEPGSEQTGSTAEVR